MKKISGTLTVLLSIIVFIACGTRDQSRENQVTSEPDEQSEKEILVSPVEDSPEFPDAILEMNSPDEYARMEPGRVQFSYDVTNYELRAQTPDADSKNCANSKDGQHIHLILNNQPYTAHYEPAFEQEVQPGHYVALSFLSRSYHESIKNPEAFILRQFTVGDAEAEEVDLSGPNLFYSRPKDMYSGDDTKKIMLDFYLINCNLSEDGYKVRATINGHEFILTEWIPYFVEGLPMGENEFMIELIDAHGNLVDSPFNRTQRTITLE
ncbi:MAG: phosphopeptide-binding protein, partial [Cyclobacteriaceae bacterium]|nr:phosphopeptide-binding protein [Cyclobacteriaceae bacterium]